MLKVVNNKANTLNICSFNLNDIFDGLFTVETKQLNSLGIKLHLLKHNWYNYFLSLPKDSTIYFGDPLNVPAGYVASCEESIEVAQDLVRLIISMGGNSIKIDNNYYILGRSKLHRNEIILALYLLKLLNPDNIYDDVIYIGQTLIVEKN